MTKKTLTDFLECHRSLEPVSFHMPGHKGSEFYRELGYGNITESLVDWDITEIEGADNLFQAESVIREIMERYARLYGSRNSYLLVNGSSCGLIAAVMACVPRGGKLVMARNCHKSVFNALTLAGVEPVYAYPKMVEEYGITGEIKVDEIQACLDREPLASAVILTSPNYYGICSDIKAIAELVHERGKLLIVDQAHGAHLKFFLSHVAGRALAAEDLGADIIIDSTHKTLASFTQTAVANICSDRIDTFAFEDALQKMESSSPSYILMESLDINADIMEKHGESCISAWRENLDWFYVAAKEIRGLKVMKHPLLDDSKINLDMSAYGLHGVALEKELMKRNIYPELATGDIVMCMTGIGNKRCDYERLITALEEIAGSHDMAAVSDKTPVSWEFKGLRQHPLPESRTKSPLGDSLGRVCAQAIIPYPPGVPIICPGEEITSEIIDYISGLRNRGESIMGIDSDGCIMVGDDH